ncbi:replication factor C subunit 3 [Schistocerca americana]|uniref:replication factor C subunit 3 n=2 Tax=Schistocerca TaxID=7008 RepID=UPI001F501D00|nr:replication factor C subunit 3 [Schistocerca americana]XP_047115154.1 replication factor C subunit 3 isoform X1 [Schistocerca piceifrons]XP_049812090.1 replication factor C subunit 3 [Schistocerca nitens]XP_049828685.1 replication factor C subunit 3 [Schistocerca gregaria]XP_049961288.1 replication factor C subunit 3 [Schistocerca serialis cubense]XP_049961290.1 replication factor C subunit 3 [Schistocerca serialis cubense]
MTNYGLLVDKYRPRDIADLRYHKDLMKKLKNLVLAGDFPHLLIHGPSGSGKRTIINCLLHELYGPGVERLRMEQSSYMTPSNKKIELMTLSSNYHIEVNPCDVGIYDRVVIQELIKGVAQTHQLDLQGLRDFKVIVVMDADRLTKDAQHALRRTMEKYIATCRIILCASSMSRVIPAILSRCLAVRVPAPSKETIISVIKSVCEREKFELPAELIDRIAEKSDRNMRRALLMTQTFFIDRTNTPTADSPVQLPDWLVFLQGVSDLMVAEQTPRQIGIIREKLYELIIHGIPTELIFKHLVDEVVEKCDMQLKTQVVAAAALYEHRLHHGNKAIMHLEAFVAKFMSIYKKFMEDMMHDMF